MNFNDASVDVEALSTRFSGNTKELVKRYIFYDNLFYKLKDFDDTDSSYVFYMASEIKGMILDSFINEMGIGQELNGFKRPYPCISGSDLDKLVELCGDDYKKYIEAYRMYDNILKNALIDGLSQFTIHMILCVISWLKTESIKRICQYYGLESGSAFTDSVRAARELERSRQL